LSTGRLLLIAAAFAALLVAAGCGGGSSGPTEATVQTGSLSKAEFIKKADAICEAARAEFLTKFESFYQAHKAEASNQQSEAAFLGEVFQSVLSPNVERQIEQISKLGAPKDYAPQAATFLNALQAQLQEFDEDPAKLTATPYAFKHAENVAKAAGLIGCSESFS